jgi:hypothetical protein
MPLQQIADWLGGRGIVIALLYVLGEAIYHTIKEYKDEQSNHKD